MKLCFYFYRHLSTSTRGAKLLKEAAKNQNEVVINPLQHYVFGSDVRLPKSSVVTDQRISLRELFQKTKISDNKFEPNTEKRKETKTKKYSVRLMRKILKKRIIHPSFMHSTSASVGTIDSASVNGKLHEILSMLDRVYHEVLAISQKSQNLWKYVRDNNFPDDRYRNRNQMLSEDIIIFPCKAISDISANHTRSKVSQPIYGKGDTNWNRERWIKSDAEYLILEL